MVVARMMVIGIAAIMRILGFLALVLPLLADSLNEEFVHVAGGVSVQVVSANHLLRLLVPRVCRVPNERVVRLCRVCLSSNEGVHQVAE